jgi:hypothetical protein
MKKFTLIIIALLTFTFAGCTAAREGKPNANAGTNANSANANKAEESKPSNTTASSEMATGSPTATMVAFIEALKKKDTETIKKSLSKESIVKLEEAAKAGKTTIDQIITEGEDMSKEKTPEMRNEKIDGDSATVEVQDEKTKNWDTIPLVKEDGSWKIAFDKMQAQ